MIRPNHVGGKRNIGPERHNGSQRRSPCGGATGYRLRNASTTGPINSLRVMSMWVVPGRTASWP